MEEQLRKELIMTAARVLGENAANRLEMAFTIVLHKYKVETKSTDVIVYDDSNARILRNYVASLRLEGKSAEGCRKKRARHFGVAFFFISARKRHIKQKAPIRRSTLFVVKTDCCRLCFCN